MNQYFNISIILFLSVSIFFTPDLNQMETTHFDPIFTTNGCGSFRSKRTEAIFQDRKTLWLNCDSTFSYKRTNCINREVSSGSWTLNENRIRLKVTNKVKRLAGKERKNKSGYNYRDLDGVILTLNDSMVTWQRSDQGTDTLYRQ